IIVAAPAEPVEALTVDGADSPRFARQTLWVGRTVRGSAKDYYAFQERLCHAGSIQGWHFHDGMTGGNGRRALPALTGPARQETPEIDAAGPVDERGLGLRAYPLGAHGAGTSIWSDVKAVSLGE